MTAGIVAWGSLPPVLAARAHGDRARPRRRRQGRGTRTVAAFDEDTTTMGVEAARLALRGPPARPGRAFFSTADPGLRRQDQRHRHPRRARLDRGRRLRPRRRGAVGGRRAARPRSRRRRRDAGGRLRLRTGLAGGPDERDGGDGAAALLFGDHDDGAGGGRARPRRASAEFLDRWRTPGETAPSVWEERFGEDEYLPLASRRSRRP